MTGEVTEFERDALSFVLELAEKCGVQPKDAFPRLASMCRRLSELRSQWVVELETVLAHAIRDRDAYKTVFETAQREGRENALRVQSQGNAIALAALALDDWKKTGSTHSITQAKAFLEAALPFQVVDGSETRGEGP